ncbi:hypothetical protein P8625_00670 [Tenacibaculum tangerinum]|uniref:Uncharacterized protein n=1 Tax=Tenacibaculum tangerinum TaxID=3038772 RepID=A0ABY8L5R7_9FLAO|nr:hypothetical protein [Tenacibaculum tangerinum]WGH75708.1 hypothetical protein P8625_00670 [Tenacibaculum tangerinum]
MVGENHIQDIQLPTTLNFKVLKEEGLSYIQEGSSSEWTNLNPSDPGVTILDQLCFALTELGYCMNFPMKDILTDATGELQIANQFFLPDTILTTAAITENDYVKLIIDTVSEVKNCMISPIPTSVSFLRGIYQTYLYINPKITDQEERQNICKAVYIQLNTNRNINELFLIPIALKPKEYKVQCQLQLEDGYTFKSIIVAIQQAINNYIFPNIPQTGYDQLREEGIAVNEIFNGPKLKNGWIKNVDIQPKKDTLHAFEITEVLLAVKGISSVQNLFFYTEDVSNKLYTVTSKKEELLCIKVLPSSTEKNVLGAAKDAFFENKTAVYFSNNLNDLFQASKPKEDIEAVQMTPEVPKGTFRDINSYYSIQNTFPTAYKVGLNALNSNAPAFQIAQSRQLKGYLTLFDQVLANEFSQLANLKTLFSFKNAISGTPSDIEEYNQLKDAYEKAHPKYPAPFVSFSPTYFYQSLYNSVPNIKPLLKNNKKFNFSYEVLSAQTLDNESWLDYQEDPYNSYVWGLKTIMEDEALNVNRRNELLNHLLARHGEAPLYINTICAVPTYTGDIVKDQVISKSIYLQNYQKLSYNRAKAYNFLGANKLYLDKKTKSVIDFAPVTEKIQEEFKKGRQVDFIPDIQKIERKQYISPSDIINYSTLDLKLNLLFALDVYYQNYLIENTTETAWWLLHNRKGFISIETSLLLKNAQFEVVFKEEINANVYWTTARKLTYDELLILNAMVEECKPSKEDVDSFIAIKKAYQLHKKENVRFDESEYCSITNSVSWSVTAFFEEGSIVVTSVASLFSATVWYIFPSYIPQFTSTTFQKRLHLFFENELPVTTAAKFVFVEDDLLKTLIKAYVQWHNELIATNDYTNQGISLLEKSNLLAKTIIQNFVSE